MMPEEGLGIKSNTVVVGMGTSDKNSTYGEKKTGSEYRLFKYAQSTAKEIEQGNTWCWGK